MAPAPTKVRSAGHVPEKSQKVSVHAYTGFQIQHAGWEIRIKGWPLR